MANIIVKKVHSLKWCVRKTVAASRY